MYYVPFMAGERYFLRLFLYVIPGSQSFKDLRTIEGIIYPTYRAAYLATGLLDDDRRWISCFIDAATW